MKSVIFFSNGNTWVNDENGQQVPDLQRSWFKQYVEGVIVEAGCDPAEFTFEVQGGAKLKPVVENGKMVNWKVEK